jgi:hypothetical protein
MRTLSTIGVVLSASLAAAQTGTDIVFVGSSVAGSSDPFFFANQSSGAPLASGGNANSDDVTDAVWDRSGNLYVAQANPPRVSRAQWNGTAVAWSTVFVAPGPCHGLGYDRYLDRLWVLTGATSSTRELVCLDVDPASAGYGSVVAVTTTLGGVVRERWELAPTGHLAAVPHASAQGIVWDLVDTRPFSPTFLQITASVPVPGTGSSATVASCAFTQYGEWAHLLYAGAGSQGLAVMNVGSRQLFDFDPTSPGQQDFAIPLPAPNRIAVALADPFAGPVVVSGHGGSGWAARIDVDYYDPGNTSFSPFTAPAGLPNCSSVSLSADDTRMAVTATPVNLSGPSYLALFDVRSGALLQYIPLPGAWNVFTTAWQDLRPTASYSTFGVGCRGSLGVPALVARHRPVLGTVASLEIKSVPGVAFVCFGFSATMYGSLALPLSLASVGMPGCTLYVAPDTVVSAFGNGSAYANMAIPNRGAMLGTVFYNQAFTFDLVTNPGVWTVSNAGRGQIGLYR